MQKIKRKRKEERGQGVGFGAEEGKKAEEEEGN